MYRQPGEREPDIRELVYVPPKEAQVHQHSIRTGLLVCTPIVACVAASILISPTASVVAFVVTATMVYVLYKRRRDESVVLSINGTTLTIAPRAAKETTSVALADLLDVTLDKEAQTRIEHGSEAKAALEAIEGRRFELKPIHVLLVRRDGDPIKLGAAPILELQATEWMGKVRSFLRKSDWIPESERSLAPPSSEN